MIGVGVAARILDGLGEGLRSLAGPLLGNLVTGLTGRLQFVEDLLTVPPNADSDTPGQRIPAVFDLARTPFPEYHAQLGGIDVRTAPGLGPSATTEQVRTYVRTRGIGRRGTPTAIIAAARTALTGTRRVILVERDGSPWRLTVRTYSAQTPDAAAVRRAIEAERPLGIVVTVVVEPGQTWGDVADAGLTFADLEAMTVDQLATAVPPETT